jgi:hypothetical protein
MSKITAPTNHPANCIQDFKSLVSQARLIVSTLSTHLIRGNPLIPNCCDSVATIVVTVSRQSAQNSFKTLSYH